MMDKEWPLEDEWFGMAIADGMDDARVENIRFQDKKAIEKEQERIFQNHVPYRKVNRALFLQGGNTREVDMLPQVFHLIGITD